MKKKTCIGIDVGGTNMRAALVDDAGCILELRRIPTHIHFGAEQAADHLIEMCRALQADAFTDNATVAAVGLGVAGKIDSRRGIVVFSPNLPAWNGFPLAVRLEEALRLPVVMENDANVFGVGENWTGSAREFHNWAGLTLGTGVGGCLIFNNRLWQGDHLGFVAELGHMIVDPSGPRCRCGSRGCLEAHSSAGALLIGVEEAVRSGSLTSGPLFKLHQEGKLTAESIHQCAHAGDLTARRLFQRMGWALGLAVSNLFMALGIRHAVVGGGVSAGWDMFEQAMRESLTTHNSFLSAEEMTVERSILGDDAAVLGAARLAWETLEVESGKVKVER